jgi:hypothetical protein
MPLEEAGKQRGDAPDRQNRAKSGDREGPERPQAPGAKLRARLFLIGLGVLVLAYLAAMLVR